MVGAGEHPTPAVGCTIHMVYAAQYVQDSRHTKGKAAIRVHAGLEWTQLAVRCQGYMPQLCAGVKT